MPTLGPQEPIHTDDVNTDSQGSAQKSSVSCRPQCVSLFKGELSQRLPIGDPADRIDMGFLLYCSQKEKKGIENSSPSLSSQYTENSNDTYSMYELDP